MISKNQTIRVTKHGFKFNVAGELMARPTISMKDNDRLFPINEGETKEQIKERIFNGIGRNNGYTIHWEEIEA